MKHVQAGLSARDVREISFRHGGGDASQFIYGKS